ncbi:hypothetical protein HYFRA_00009278 [Hymenoscyphus fraxineus]|uniref:Uncharacterized protein n=1 Tax=Hymenoscyphus fraxineus TaxID=746836 RepID=A0A9N9L3U8_9HELO|nr:hypothetical protein HYFRA_00009278 [Hymenoscyphus fraxineus]
MLSIRDQENLVHGHQTAAASKPLNQSTRSLQPKTPGNKYPKTPLRVPLNDENAPGIFGGKSVKGKGLENMMNTGKKGATLDKNSFVTPAPGTRNRAPLGMKTTNAKAKAFQTPSGPAPGKDAEKTQQMQTSARRPKRAIYADAVKLEVHGDESPLQERDLEVEYAPPRPKDIPYQSEDFPANCLNYDFIKPGNLMKGALGSHRQQVDAQGRTRLDRELEESYERSARKADERILKMMQEEEWTVGDVPETFRHLRKKDTEQSNKDGAGNVKKVTARAQKPPATIVSRRAASALSVVSKTTSTQVKAEIPAPKPKGPISFLSRPKPIPLPITAPSTLRNSAAVNTSKSTIGYSKGRSASGALQKAPVEQNTAGGPQKRAGGGLTRSVSDMSQASDRTMTPARFAKQGHETDEWKKRLSFLSAFDVEEEDLEPGLRGVMPDSLRAQDEDDEEFVLTLM